MTGVTSQGAQDVYDDTVKAVSDEQKAIAALTAKTVEAELAGRDIEGRQADVEKAEREVSKTEGELNRVLGSEGIRLSLASEDRTEKVRSEAFEKTRNGARFSKNSVTPSKNLAWAIENGVLSSQDQGALWSAVNRHAYGEQLVQFNDGLYMVERGSKIMITDADNDTPSLEAVYEITDKNSSVVGAAKGVFYEQARRNGTCDDAMRIVKDTFGDGSITKHTYGAYSSNGRQNGLGKGSLRGADNQGYSKWKDKGEVRRKSIAVEDAEYLELAREPEKNRTRLQEMVDERAKKAGYDVGYVVYRGDSAPYNVLKKGSELEEKYGIDEFNDDHGNLGDGLYFTPQFSYAERVAGQKGVVRKFYLKADFADITQADTRKILMAIKNDIEDEVGYFSRDELYQALMDETVTNGIKAKSVSGLAGIGSEEVIVQESWQAKLADPVTYDDDGNVIPLSERFRTDRTGDEEWKNGDIRFSIANTQGMSIEKQLNAFYNGRFKSSDAFYFGETPDNLAAIGIKKGPLAMTITDFRKSTAKKHDIPRRVIKSVGADLKNAIAAFESNGRYGIVTEDIDSNGKRVLVAIDINGVMDRAPVNLIQSIYGIDNPKEWIASQIRNHKRFTALSKEKAEQFLQTYGYKASVEENVSFNADTIQEISRDVKQRFSKSVADNASEGGNEFEPKYRVNGMKALWEKIEEIKAAESWTGEEIRKVLRAHEEVDFIKRIHDGDKTAVGDIKKCVEGMNVRQLSDFRWYLSEAVSWKDRKEYRSAITKFKKAVNEAIVAYRNLGKENVGRDLGIKSGKTSKEEIKRLFYELNSDNACKEIADRVFDFTDRYPDLLREINFKKLISDPLKGGFRGHQIGWLVEYDTPTLNSTYVTDQEKARILLHEMIHSCTTYALWNYENNYKLRKGRVDEEDQRIYDACETIFNVYNSIKNDSDMVDSNGKKFYGIKSEYEMVAELANTEFREALEKKNLLQRIIDAIKTLLGFDTATAYDAVSKAFYEILENYSSAYEDAYLTAYADQINYLDIPRNYLTGTEKIRSEAFEKTRNGARFSKNSVTPSKNLAWAIENGVLSSQDQGALWSAVNRHAYGEQLVQFNDGLYMVERGNKIMITDADMDTPSLEAVYEITDKNSSVIGAAKGAFYDEARYNGTSDDAMRTVKTTFGDGSIIKHTKDTYRTNGRQNGLGKGSLRGADNQGYSKRKDKGEVRRKSIAAEDAEYMELAKEPEKNRTRLQEMVDERAKKAGYDVGYVVYRGDSAPYNVLKKGSELDKEYGIDEFNDDHGNLGDGLYFTPQFSYAERVAGQKGVVRKFYLKADFADITQADTRKILIAIKNDIEDEIGDFSRDELYQALMDETGKNGIKAKSVSGLAGIGSEEVIVQESWQAKLADPVTYDDEGNVIPLSERFRTDRTGDEEWKNGDIRFSKATEWNTPGNKVSQSEIDAIQRISKKSVNQFGSSDIAATKRLAEVYWGEMGVKSPFFRAWFGDWKQYDKTPVSVAKKAGETSGVVYNPDTGWNIQFGSKVKDETSAHRSSINNAARQYLPYIKDILSNAVLIDSATVGGRGKSMNTLLMHTLYAVADIGNGRELLRVYVEEMNNPNDSDTSKRAYVLQNIEKYAVGVVGSPKNQASPITKTAYIKTVADLFAAVKEKDSDFKPNPVSEGLLDENGRPKVFYHGTPRGGFTVFDPARSGKRGSFTSSRLGMFFTSDLQYARSFSHSGGSESDIENGFPDAQVYPVYLKVEHPLIVFSTELLSENEVSEIERELKSGNYDGIMDELGQVVVLEPTQIKSATDNIGTFDGRNKDIRYSLVGRSDDGMEIYESNPEVLSLTWKERKKSFLNLMKNDYHGRTAKFINPYTGDVSYARFDIDDLNKIVYGNKNSDIAGRDAVINTGAGGDIFSLVENSRYDWGRSEKGKSTSAHRNLTGWDYYVKTVQIDNKVFDLIANVRKKAEGEFVYSLQLNESKMKAPALPLESVTKTARSNNGAPTSAYAQKDSTGRFESQDNFSKIPANSNNGMRKSIAADEAADMRDMRLAEVLTRTAKGPEGEAIRRAAEREKNDAVQAVKEQAKLDILFALTVWKIFPQKAKLRKSSPSATKCRWGVFCFLNSHTG